MEKQFIVMYVDDSAPDRMMFRHILQAIDKFIKYVPAKSGQDALDYLHNAQLPLPDYIFLDVTMPGMDGIECLEKIKKIKRAKKIPVLMYSVSHPKSIKETAKFLGATDCLPKELDIDKSSVAVAMAINKLTTN